MGMEHLCRHCGCPISLNQHSRGSGYCISCSCPRFLRGELARVNSHIAVKEAELRHLREKIKALTETNQRLIEKLTDKLTKPCLSCGLRGYLFGGLMVCQHCQGSGRLVVEDHTKTCGVCCRHGLAPSPQRHQCQYCKHQCEECRP